MMYVISCKSCDLITLLKLKGVQNVRVQQFFVCCKQNKNGSGEKMPIYSGTPWENERALRVKQGKGLPNKVNKGLRIQNKVILLNDV